MHCRSKRSSSILVTKDRQGYQAEIWKTNSNLGCKNSTRIIRALKVKCSYLLAMIRFYTKLVNRNPVLNQQESNFDIRVIDTANLAGITDRYFVKAN